MININMNIFRELVDCFPTLFNCYYSTLMRKSCQPETKQVRSLQTIVIKAIEGSPKQFTGFSTGHGFSVCNANLSREPRAFVVTRAGLLSQPPPSALISCTALFRR